MDWLQSCFFFIMQLKELVPPHFWDSLLKYQSSAASFFKVGKEKIAKTDKLKINTG